MLRTVEPAVSGIYLTRNSEAKRKNKLSNRRAIQANQSASRLRTYFVFLG